MQDKRKIAPASSMRDRSTVEQKPKKALYSEGSEGRQQQEKTENIGSRRSGFSAFFALFSSFRALRCENALYLDRQPQRSCVCPVPGWVWRDERRVRRAFQQGPQRKAKAGVKK